MKYELTNETIVINGITLYRIIALKSFLNITKGDLGGYVEGYKNLSQSDDSWVYDNSKAFGNSEVYGNALVFGNAKVFGNAQVFNNAWVYDDAMVFGDSRICDNVQVFDHTIVCYRYKR